MGLFLSLLLNLCLVPTSPAHTPVLKARLGNANLAMEVAESDKDRAQGLMFRKFLPKNQGMLFVFEREFRLSFWMKNTLIPLSIGFFDHEFRLVDMQEMTPAQSVIERTPPTYTSQEPAVLALEMNKGWFTRNHIRLGQRLELLSPPSTPLLRGLNDAARPKSK